MLSRPAANFHSTRLFSAQGIYETSLTAKTFIGDKLQLGERVFYYALNGAADLYGGNLIETAYLAGATTEFQTQCAISVAAPIGSTNIYMTSVTTAQAANLFSDGWAGIYDDESTDSYYTYKVKKNTALAATGTTGYITLYDEMHIALTTSDKVLLTTNPFKSVVIADYSTPAGASLGFAPVNVTAAYYFWLQTWGPVNAAISSAALTIGYDVVRSTAADGLVMSQVAGASSVGVDRIGRCLAPGTASKGALINVEIMR